MTNQILSESKKAGREGHMVAHQRQLAFRQNTSFWTQNMPKTRANDREATRWRQVKKVKRESIQFYPSLQSFFFWT